MASTTKGSVASTLFNKKETTPAVEPRKNVVLPGLKLETVNDGFKNEIIDMGFNEALARHALKQVSNASVEAALDLLFNLSEDEKILIETDYSNLQKSLLESTKQYDLFGNLGGSSLFTSGQKKIKSEWTCDACTFLNKAPAVACEMCTSAAPNNAYEELIKAPPPPPPAPITIKKEETAPVVA